MDRERKTEHANKYGAAWVSTLLVLTAILNMYETKSPRMVQNHQKAFAYTKNMNKVDWSQHHVKGMTYNVPAYDAFMKEVILPSITICTSEFSINFFPDICSTHSCLQINLCLTRQF